MAEVIEFPGRSTAHDDASVWLARLDRGLSEAEEVELRRRLGQDPRFREAFLELAAFWDEMDILSELCDLFPLDKIETKSARRTARMRWSAAAAAAIAVAATTILWDVAPWVGSPPEPETTARPVEFDRSFETVIGRQVSEYLPDGSIVRLNTDTLVKVEYTRARRDVFLARGEAYFDVAPDPAHPFSVHAGDRIVQAVGTAFNVYLGPDGDIEVTVTEGRVRVLPADAASRGVTGTGEDETDATLVSGDVARLSRHGSQILQIEPVEMDVKLAWQRGALIFQGDPLEDVLQEVSRYTTTRFVLENQELGVVRVGGYFRAGDIDGLLVALRENFQIVSEHTSDGVITLRAPR